MGTNPTLLVHTFFCQSFTTSMNISKASVCPLIPFLNKLSFSPLENVSYDACYLLLFDFDPLLATKWEGKKKKENIFFVDKKAVSIDYL